MSSIKKEIKTEPLEDIHDQIKAEYIASSDFNEEFLHNIEEPSNHVQDSISTAAGETKCEQCDSHSKQIEAYQVEIAKLKEKINSMHNRYLL